MSKSIRLDTCLQILPLARDAGAVAVIDACNKVIEADRLGWTKHADARRMAERIESGEIVTLQS